MRKVLWVVGVTVICIPMLLVGWLLLAARWAAMDRFTLQAPSALRSGVAEMVINRAGYGKTSVPALRRGLQFDAGNAEGWSRLCSASIDEPGAGVAACKTAVRLEPTAMNEDSLGDAQAKTGDVCAAEDSYTRAAGKVSGSGGYEYLQSMGRAGLRCGDLPGSRAGLEAAVVNGQKYLNDASLDDDERKDAADDLLKNREYLIVIYQRQHQEVLEAGTCSAAHPDWKSCHCDVDSKGTVACGDGGVVAAKQ